MKTKYEIQVQYHGVMNYIVEASSYEEAAMEAKRRFQARKPGDMLGNEHETVQTTHIPALIMPRHR